MEQARHEPEPTSARYEALVAEIVPKLRRLGPQLSEQTLRQTAERLAAHRLAAEQAEVATSTESPARDAYPSFPAFDADASAPSPLDDANVRQLAVSLTNRIRPVSLHLSEGELVSLATRMAVLEASSGTRPANGSGPAAAPAGAPRPPEGTGAGSAPPTPARSEPARTPEYDAATVNAMAERYARADAALTTYPWLGLLVGAGIGYVASLAATHALRMRVDNAVTTSVVLVLFGSTIGLLLGRAKGNLESHRLREEARATLAVADRKRSPAS